MPLTPIIVANKTSSLCSFGRKKKKNIYNKSAVLLDNYDKQNTSKIKPKDIKSQQSLSDFRSAQHATGTLCGNSAYCKTTTNHAAAKSTSITHFVAFRFGKLLWQTFAHDFITDQLCKQDIFVLFIWTATIHLYACIALAGALPKVNCTYQHGNMRVLGDEALDLIKCCRPNLFEDVRRESRVMLKLVDC